MAAPAKDVLQGWRLDPWLRLIQAKDRMRGNLWFAPALGTVLALGAAVGAVRLDRHVTGEGTWLFDGGPESARELLSTIASSMLTFTALVFSITILALQLASNQFSPRVIRTFLQERVTKLAMATFVGTFVYSVAVLSRVRSAPDVFVPEIGTWVALVLVLASVGVFIQYVHRMAHSIRAITVITKIASETREAIDEMFPDECRTTAKQAEQIAPAGAPDSVLRHHGLPGVVTFVDRERLVSLARASDSRFELVPRIGDFVPTGAELLRVWGPPADLARCCAAIAFDIERTAEQDPAFGLRQLVDIAVRAVSPGINDPSTAVQALDHLHDLVRRVTLRDVPAQVCRDEEKSVRLTIPPWSYAELVQLAFEEIRDYGASSVQVIRRIERALLDCAAVAPEDKRGVLEHELRVLAAARA